MFYEEWRVYEGKIWYALIELDVGAWNIGNFT